MVKIENKMRHRIFFNISGLLLICILSSLIISCGKDKEDVFQPITLSFGNGDPINNNIDFVLSESVSTLELFIKGGDESYKVSNSNDDVISVQQKEAKIILTPLIIGKSTITINDNSKNSYSLSIIVTSSAIGLSSYKCLIYGDNLTNEDKTSLETEMLSLIKGYKFIYNDDRRTGVCRMFFDKIDGKKYDEYDFVTLGEIPESCKPIMFQEQIISWWTLKSETEDTVLFITNYIGQTKNMAGTRMPTMSNSLVIDATNRYKAKYSNLEKAYIVQI